MAQQSEAQRQEDSTPRRKRRRKFYESPSWSWPQFDPESCQQCGHVIPMHETGWILQKHILCESCFQVLDEESQRRGSVTIAPGVVLLPDEIREERNVHTLTRPAPADMGIDAFTSEGVVDSTPTETTTTEQTSQDSPEQSPPIVDDSARSTVSQEIEISSTADTPDELTLQAEVAAPSEDATESSHASAASHLESLAAALAETGEEIATTEASNNGDEQHDAREPDEAIEHEPTIAPLAEAPEEVEAILIEVSAAPAQLLKGDASSTDIFSHMTEIELPSMQDSDQVASSADDQFIVVEQPAAEKPSTEPSLDAQTPADAEAPTAAASIVALQVEADHAKATFLESISVAPTDAPDVVDTTSIDEVPCDQNIEPSREGPADSTSATEPAPATPEPTLALASPDLKKPDVDAPPAPPAPPVTPSPAPAPSIVALAAKPQAFRFETPGATEPSHEKPEVPPPAPAAEPSAPPAERAAARADGPETSAASAETTSPAPPHRRRARRRRHPIDAWLEALANEKPEAIVHRAMSKSAFPPGFDPSEHARLLDMAVHLRNRWMDNTESRRPARSAS